MLMLQRSSCCDICIEEYDPDKPGSSPHTIDCGHIFCGTCIRSVSSNLCPMCRVPFTQIIRLRVDRTDGQDQPSTQVHLPSNHGLVRFRDLSMHSRTVGGSHLARCNGCQQMIYGVRYKCTHPDCPDYDLCGTCEALPLPVHPPSHCMLKIRALGGFTPSEVEHRATCDGCDAAIRGIRYRCMHPDCPDYDLCRTCEANPVPAHPLDHPMLKMKTADTAVPIVLRAGQTMTATITVDRVFNSSHPHTIHGTFGQRSL